MLENTVVYTTTFYPKYTPEIGTQLSLENQTDVVRGTLALEMITAAQQAGSSIAVVDGGSSDSFRLALSQGGSLWEVEKERGMSGSRRQALRLALREAVDTKDPICIWQEPEKVDLTKFYEVITAPIREGRADIVIPRRTQQSLATYPDFQVFSEILANVELNKVFKTAGILPKDVSEIDGYALDLMFGPRVFRATPEIIELMTRRYEIGVQDGQSWVEQMLKNYFTRLKNNYLKLEYWNAATFFPITNALREGLRVVSVDVDFQYPKLQKEIETDSRSMQQKRRIQRVSIVAGNARLLNQEKYPNRLGILYTSEKTS